MQIENFIESGATRFFEYHCNESHDSADAQLWYRSHQQVTVLNCDNADQCGLPKLCDREDAAEPLVYKIQFSDGYVGAAFEDELLTAGTDYCRPAPPPARAKP